MTRKAPIPPVAIIVISAFAAFLGFGAVASPGNSPVVVLIGAIVLIAGASGLLYGIIRAAIGNSRR